MTDLLIVVRRLLAAAPLLLLATACSVGKAPQQADAEADYVSAKRAYLASLAADRNRGTPDSVLDAYEEAALRDLAGRLRKILGPFQAVGFADSGTSNVTTLVLQVDFGAIDGIAYHSPDSTTVLVTTRALLAAWLRDSVAGDTTTPRDPASALARPELYARAFPEDAAVFKNADIPLGHPAQSGVVAAMLVARAQDFGAFTPNEVVVSVVRGNRVYLADAPARALIPPMPSCVSVWDEARRKEDSLFEARRSDSTRSTGSDSSEHTEDRADAAVRRCGAEHVSADPRLAVLVQQVDSIVRRLPPQ